MPKRKKPEVILGFVGKLCAGKGVSTAFLVEKYGFYYSSCSDRIREEILKRGEEITREKLQEVGGELRQKFGPAVLAKRTWIDICRSEAKKAVVDSIRGKEEVEFLKTIPGFYLVAIEADPRTRFKRMVERGIKSDPLTWEEFLRTESRDVSQDGRNIEACIEMADFKVENNGTIEELQKKIEKILKSIS